MAGEWVETSLAAVMDVNHGFAFPGENIREDLPGDILLTPGNFAIGGGFKGDRFKYFDGEVPTDYVLSEGDLIITMTDLSKQADTLGYPALVPKSGGTRFLHNQRLGKVLIKDKAELDRGYLYYLLCTADYRHEVLASATGTTVKHTSPSRILAYKASIPPLAEQKAIAAVLGALDDKIELNRRMNATLEAMARALFQSWFVDFDPVRAKLDGREPVGLDPGTAALFQDSFQDSELGYIPTGWKVTTLGACIGFRSGFSFKSQDWQESGVPVVKIGSVKPGIIDLSQVSYVSEEIAHQAARYRLSTGDMLIGMTGYVGEVGLVPPSTNPPLLNQRVGKFVMPKAGTESLTFWYCTTRQPEFRAFVEARSHGTAQANVSGDAIMQFPLVAPVPEILDAFNRECQPMLDLILSNHAESCTLATLRDTLLPKLLSGELQPTQGCPTGETLCLTT
jgi:type I restriction enzyme S subunit